MQSPSNTSALIGLCPWTTCMMLNVNTIKHMLLLKDVMTKNCREILIHCSFFTLSLSKTNGCQFSVVCTITDLIIKITISSTVIGLKNSYFPLIHSPSCYQTACYRTACYQTIQQTNHIQSCSLNKPITTLVSITIETVYKLLNLCILCQFFNVNFPVVT